MALFDSRVERYSFIAATLMVIAALLVSIVGGFYLLKAILASIPLLPEAWQIPARLAFKGVVCGAAARILLGLFEGLKKFYEDA